MSDSEAIVRESGIYDEDGKTNMPKAVREYLGITKGDRIVWVAKNGCLMITPPQYGEEE